MIQNHSPNKPALLFCLILLTGCSGSTISVTTPPTRLVTALMPSVTSSSTMGSTPTHILATWATLDATAVSVNFTQDAVQASTHAASEPSATPYPTDTPEPTLPIATQKAIATIRAFPSICLSLESVNLSPDGKWLAINCFGEEPDEIEIMKISSLDKKYVWKLAYGKTIGTGVRGIYGRIEPFHWSHDGHYLYLKYYKQGDGGDYSFEDGQGLLRLDLFSGNVSEVLPRGWYAFSLSPNDNLLAFVHNLFDSSGHPLLVQILNLTKGNVQKVELDSRYIEAGDFIWSGDQNQLVFAAARGNVEHEKMSLLRVNLRTLVSEMLVDDLPEGFFPKQIRPDGVIVLGNPDYFQPKGPDLLLIKGALVPIP